MCRFDAGAVVLATWQHTVESYAPTLNSISTNTKNNHKYRWWRASWEGHFGAWLRTVPPAKQYRRVTITRLYGLKKRPYDRKNFEGGCKPLLDTLTTYGALYDDSVLWCEDHYVQDKSPDGKDYVTVRLEELA